MVATVPSKPFELPPEQEAKFIAERDIENHRRLAELQRSAREAARYATDLELQDRLELMSMDLEDPELHPDSLAVLVEMYRPYITEYRAELDRRAALASGRAPTPLRATQLAAVDRLRDLVKQRVEVADVLEAGGYKIDRSPFPHAESHSPCPACGGRDRFVIRPAPNSRGWCRRCHFWTDAIGAAQTIWATTFSDAVSRLAERFVGEPAGAA